jgi:hypothetical protein
MVVTTYNRAGRVKCEYRVIDDVATVVSGPTRVESDGTLKAADDIPGCETWPSTVDAQLDRIEVMLLQTPGFTIRYDDRGVPLSVTAPGDPAVDGGSRTEVEVLA